MLYRLNLLRGLKMTYSKMSHDVVRFDLIINSHVTLNNNLVERWKISLFTRNKSGSSFKTRVTGSCTFIISIFRGNLLLPFSEKIHSLLCQISEIQFQNGGII